LETPLAEEMAAVVAAAAVNKEGFAMEQAVWS